MPDCNNVMDVSTASIVPLEGTGHVLSIVGGSLKRIAFGDFGGDITNISNELTNLTTLVGDRPPQVSGTVWGNVNQTLQELSILSNTVSDISSDIGVRPVDETRSLWEVASSSMPTVIFDQSPQW